MTVTTRFLDTNILLRYFTLDDEQKAQRSLALLTRVERGEEKIETSTMVVFETVYALQRLYRVPRDRIKELILDLIQMPSFHIPGKNILHEAFELYVNKSISFADAYNAAYMRSRSIAEIYSWDTDFDRIEGITRVEPE